MKFLYVMDPIERIDITKDTTFAFLRESQSRDIENFYCGIEDMAVREGRLMVRAAAITVRPVQGKHAELGKRVWRPAEDFHCVWMRKDPPFDMDFYFATQQLSIIDERRTMVFNRASALREANEKMFILRFPELTAPTIVSSDRDVILDFREEMGGDIVVKPLDGCGGLGVFRIAPGDLNTFSILETSTDHGRRQIMAQRYLPESRKGDMRLLYLDGQPLGAILRVPKEQELRGNIHVGGIVEAVPIGERERHICATLAPHLDKLGIWFAGLDVIGGCLTEVNVTSPTGIQEADELGGENLEAKVIDFAVARCRELQR
jgi:glutathione synthase